MREVTKWNKNYLSGDEKEVKVFKPDNGAIGRVKIELKNSHEKLTNETFTENFIPIKNLLEEAYKLNYSAVRYGGAFSACSGVSQSTAFDMLILGTSADEETPESYWANFGKCVGFCPRNDEAAGTNPLRGIYNKIESYEEIENGYYHAHMVYDFGTSQGNGTFNSIWWKRKTSNANPYIGKLGVHWTSPQHKLRSYNNIENDRVYTACNGQYYSYNPTDKKYYKLINAEYWINGAGSKKEDKEKSCLYEQEIPLTLNSYGDKYVCIENIERKSDNNWNNIISKHDLVLYDKNNLEIKRIVIDYKSFSNLETFSNEIKDGSCKLEVYPMKILKVSEAGHVFMIVRHARNDSGCRNNYYRYVKESDSLVRDGNWGNGDFLVIYDIENSSWILEPSLSNIDNLRIQATPNLINLLGKTTVHNKDVFYTRASGINTFSIVETDSAPYCFKQEILPMDLMTFPGGSSGYTKVWGHVHGTNYFFTQGDGLYTNSNSEIAGDIVFTYGYSAHTKLPSPVTKTSADTMKITYDYYIQIPKIADKDEDYLTYKDEAGNALPNPIKD